MRKTLDTQLKEQTEGTQQAEASLADLEQKKKQEGDQALAAEQRSRKAVEDALAEAKERLQQASQVNAISVVGGVSWCHRYQSY